MQQGTTNYRSAYANQFTPKDRQPVAPILQGQPDNAICFGTQALPMLTTNAASFTAKQATKQKLSAEPALGVVLGESNEDMQTMNQLFHNKKQPVKVGLPESTMKELRGTHFGMGQAPLNYHTESNNNYRSTPGPLGQGQLSSKAPVYESGTWMKKDAKFQGQTTNQKEFPQCEVKPFERVAQFTRNGMDLGGHVGDYTSEFKGKYPLY